jgi:hypothetical protein
MKQFPLFAILAISLAIFLSCGGGSDDPEIKTQNYLQGTVRDASTNKPIADAEITLSFGGSTLHQGKTDSTGTFSFPISSAGDYLFQVSADGYEDTEKLFPLTDLSKNEVAIAMVPSTFLTIKNESTFALEKVIWNGVDFGSMAVNAPPVRKAVAADKAQITFSVPGKGLNAKINVPLEIGQGEDVAYSIRDTVLVAEINESIAGIFENSATLRLVEKAEAPKTGNLNITDISYVSAKLNSSIAKSGNPQFTEKGFCYSKELGDVEFNCVAVEGEFIKIIEGLSDSTKYYAKTYISNGKHPKQFSEAVNFTTLSGNPSVSVGNATSVSYNTATLNGSVLKPGMPNYTERGFCYGTNSKPEKGGANTLCEAVAGATSNFQLAATDLADSTKYYVRAYIDNGKHTIQYSDTVSFVTLSGMPNIAMNGIANVTASSALLKGSVLNTANSNYTEKGFCYSITNDLPIKGTSTAACEIVEGEQRNFELGLTSLQIAKTYYVRAYIENSYGIRYSSVATFNTNNIFLDDRDNKEYKIKDIGNGIIWFLEDLAYGSKTQYTWAEALNLSSACNSSSCAASITTKHQGICPIGWHIPDNSEWNSLYAVWAANKTEFTAFSNVVWWSATEYSDDGASRCYYSDYGTRCEGTIYGTVISTVFKTYTYSVRCVRD